ncbi:FAD-dependent oxidoreductase [Streptacidiphilus sp. MAP5-3]|uniref:FAD-dependent oxidoreductase n=1 Tax=unclassified Streptacidiphilus TaxID=2643834 RepID=UPI0035197E0C
MGLRVAVIGGGLGGLCLAQGLRKAGIDVTVYERDATSAMRRQGYRLHVDARAGLALQRCLPPELWELFLATCSRASTRFTVVTEHLRQLHEVAGDPAVDTFAAATLATSVNRQTLREILARGLDVEYGREFVGYELTGDLVHAVFADGSHADADLLVGADGVNSAVRRQYLPESEVIDTGGLSVYGKTPLTEETSKLVPPSLLDGFTAVIGGQVGMATGLVRFRKAPGEAGLSPVGDYMMWAVTAEQRLFRVSQDRLDAMAAAELHALTGSMIRSWHRDLRALHALADIDETFLVRIRTSVPTPAWKPSRVTVLGDAIHAMSPARGSGANTALQDAGLLCHVLTEAAPDEKSLLAAVGAYEAQMREYGNAAVEASRKAEAEYARRRGGPMFWLYRRLARNRPS